MSSKIIQMRPAEVVNAKSPYLALSQRASEGERTYVVLGVERGGTSMVAAIMRALGLDMGNDRCGLNHEDPWFLTEDHELLAERIRMRDEENKVWGFKVPKSTLHWRYYEKQLRNPHFIIVFRNPAAVADSWMQRRTTNNYSSVFKHVMRYYVESCRCMTESKAPIMTVNYERACAQQDEVIEGISNFLGIDVDQSDVSKARQVITGDGQGYVNLPEHYFHVERLDGKALPEEATVFSLQDNLAELPVSEDGYYQFRRPRVRMEWDRLAARVSGQTDLYFPRVFYISFDFVPHQDVNLELRPFRFYFDYMDRFFPGHATRPVITAGRNVFRIETTGSLKRFAIGALELDTKASFKNIEFVAE